KARSSRSEKDNKVNAACGIQKSLDEALFSDIHEVKYAFDLLLNSQIPECLDIIVPKRQNSMYHSMAYASLLGCTALLSFQREDFGNAIEAMKTANRLANSHRLQSWRRALTPFSIADIKGMTTIQKHAELVFAETGLMKTGLKILHDQKRKFGIKEAVNAYMVHGIYSELENYMLYVQKLAASGENIQEYGLDGHLVSGIAFGMASFNLAFSAIPEFLLRLAQVIGFSGDRNLAMWYCRSIGGWINEKIFANLQQNNGMPGPGDGLRRHLSDFVLMGYNLVVSKFTMLSHVDEELGSNILTYHLEKYPNGMLYLALKGRQLANLRKLDEAKEYYNRSMNAQKLWPQLQHVSLWELGTIHLIEQDWSKANEIFTMLRKESNWSKCCFTYLDALTTYMAALDLYAPGTKRDELLSAASRSMKKVDSLKQRIAGKSIFLEKFVARKSRKFALQGNRLLFPDLEILFVIGALELMPMASIHRNLKRLNVAIDRLNSNNRSYYVHDDIALAHLLRATFYRLLFEQEDMFDQTQHSYLSEHQNSIGETLLHAPLIQLDHWMFYYAKLEQSQMLILQCQFSKAKSILDDLLRHSEKGTFNIGQGERAKSKYSLETALILKCHGCL
ncbi:hypothetical protein DM01DRAFT_1273631, partial [Hesseltinella vesiculosa]